MLTASGEQTNASTGGGTTDNDTPSLSNKRRGTWGDLWE